MAFQDAEAEKLEEKRYEKKLEEKRYATKLEEKRYGLGSLTLTLTLTKNFEHRLSFPARASDVRRTPPGDVMVMGIRSHSDLHRHDIKPFPSNASCCSGSGPMTS